jgi:hypothetical protein
MYGRLEHVDLLLSEHSEHTEALCWGLFFVQTRIVVLVHID